MAASTTPATEAEIREARDRLKLCLALTDGMSEDDVEIEVEIAVVRQTCDALAAASTELATFRADHERLTRELDEALASAALREAQARAAMAESSEFRTLMEAAQAEVARLRAALWSIADIEPATTEITLAHEMAQEARAALAVEGAGHE